MRGILGNFHNVISGDASRSIHPLDLFAPGTPGGLWRNYLQDLYKTPTADTPQFKAESGALQDILGREANAQGENFSLSANAGGFYDSGARLAGMQDINRNKMASYSTGLAEILTRLEHEKMSAAFPYLQMQQANWNAYYGAIAKAQDEQNFRGAQLGAGISGGLSAGMGGGGGGGGGYAGGDSTSGVTAYGSWLGAGTGEG